MALFYYVFVAAISFNLVWGNEQCNCKESLYTSSWGDFTATSRCDGKCNGIIRGVQDCYASLNDLVLPTQKCHIERGCSNPESCEGYWSTWSTIGSCGVSCEQPQARYCYKNGTALLLRNNFCIGSNGLSEENRHEPCNHGACDPTRIRTASTTATTTTRSRLQGVVTRPTTTPTPFTVSNSTSSLDGNITSVFVANTNQNDDDVTAVVGSGEPDNAGGVTLRQSEAVDATPAEDNTTILLISILGSVGLICIAVVILGLAMVVTRRRRNRSGTTRGSNIVSEDDPHNLKNSSYETVGPALPDRPPFRAPPTPKVLDSIYEAPPDKEKHLQSKQSTLDADNYLLPLPYSSEEELNADQEAIYCNIDENKR